MIEFRMRPYGREILIIGVLFPTIPLMMVGFVNRYNVLANWIRNNHDEALGENSSSKDAKRFLLQIRRLHGRLRLISIIQSFAAMAFVLALMAMIAVYFNGRALASMLFIGSISLLMISMLMFTREIQIANRALDVRLSDLEQNEGRQRYLKPKRRRREKAH